MLAVIVCCLGPILLIPIIMSAVLFFRRADNPLSMYTILLMLKPLAGALITLWGLSIIIARPISDSLTRGSIVILFAVPGALLTLLILLPYHKLVMGETAIPIARRLLGMDLTRWLITTATLSFIIAALGSSSQLASLPLNFLIPIAVAMPSLFAAIAFASVNNYVKAKNDEKSKRKPKDEADVFFEAFAEMEEKAPFKAKKGLKTSDD